MSNENETAMQSEQPALKPSLGALTARRETVRFLKFLVDGGVGFLVDTGTLSALVWVGHVNRMAAKGAGFVLAVLSNFLWNRFWTYPESRSKPVLAQVMQFALVSLVGLGINVAVFGFVDRLAEAPFGSGLALYVAQCAAVGTALIWNFVANRFITYGDVGIGH